MTFSKNLNKSGKKSLKKTAQYAAGYPAMLSTYKHITEAMPLVRGWKALWQLNRKKGIDCPSCAWPDPDGHRSPVAEYCENGAKAIAEEATTRKIGQPFFQNYSIAELMSKTDYWLGQQGRLDQPMLKSPGGSHYTPIEWDQAFSIIAQHINALDTPDQCTFYTSGRASNEAAYLYQLLVRTLGTNNLPDCSNMCHESSGVALSHTIGIGKGTVTLEDFNQAEVILIIGQNPGTNHPRMLSALAEAKKHGAKIVSINPLKEAGLLGFKNPQKLKGILNMNTPLSDLYLQNKINSDLAIFKYLVATLLEPENKQYLDTAFIETHCHDFEQLQKHYKSVTKTNLVADTGLDKMELDQLADLILNKKKIIACWAMGLTQHQNAVATIQELSNILLLKGSIGTPGAGLCPVRGHSNVQGDRTMGIMHKPSKAFNQAIQNRYNITVPTTPGLDVVETIHALHQGMAKVFIALGGNFVSASPDTNFVIEAMNKAQLTVHISTKLNRSHLATGQTALILPCLGRTDKDLQNGVAQKISTENSMGVVQSSEGILEPVSQNLMSEPAIIANLGHALFGNKPLPWKAMATDYTLIRSEISAVIEGFKDYENKLAQDGGFYLPNSPKERHFTTHTGKANFTTNHWEPIALAPNEFVLMTIRSHDQFNTTIYGLNDRYRGIENQRRIVFMNPEDIQDNNLSEGDLVDMESCYNNKKRRSEAYRIIPYNIPKGNLACYFPEANELVPLEVTAHNSNTPISKSIVVKISKN
jgi:molybdopterin-dependent oxidoreductase alpha subunit